MLIKSLNNINKEQIVFEWQFDTLEECENICHVLISLLSLVFDLGDEEEKETANSVACFLDYTIHDPQKKTNAEGKEIYYIEITAEAAEILFNILLNCALCGYDEIISSHDAEKELQELFKESHKNAENFYNMYCAIKKSYDDLYELYCFKTGKPVPIFKKKTNTPAS